MAAADRRRLDNTKQGAIAGPPGSQPSLTHHHSMNNAVSGQQPHSIAPHPGVRPGLDRAHTFPTPPTSASSTSVGLSNQGSQYDWGGSNMGNGVQTTQPLMIESHPHSTPATPATTPPGAAMPSLQPYQSHQTYDNSRPIYSAATQQQAQYAPQQNMSRGAPLHSSAYGKQDMGPPNRAPGSQTGSEHGDLKHDPYSHSQGNEQVGHGTGEEEVEHEHDSDYPHDNSNAYTSHRAPYGTYPPASNIGSSLHTEHAQASSEMNGSSSHPNGSGRGTPRDPTGSQQHWATAGYNTPPRAPPSGNLYNPMSDTRGSLPNGNASGDPYSTAPLQSPYAPTQTNGLPQSSKRMREDDDYQSRPSSRSDDLEAMKRRKLGREGSAARVMGNGSYETEVKSLNRPRNISTPRARR